MSEKSPLAFNLLTHLSVLQDRNEHTEYYTLSGASVFGQCGSDCAWKTPGREGGAVSYSGTSLRWSAGSRQVLRSDSH